VHLLLHTITLLGLILFFFHLAVVCDRRFENKALPENLVVIAACNPYRKSISTSTAGLVHHYSSVDDGHHASQDEIAQLAYTVYPLPEIMKQYVWDFGSLSAEAEHQYIYSLLASCSVRRFRVNHLAFCEAVDVSHKFMKEHEKQVRSLVSLRDVLRCISLYEWFMNYLVSNREAPGNERTSSKAIMLALAVCYYYRLKYIITASLTILLSLASS